MGYVVTIIESTALIPEDKISLAIELGKEMVSKPPPYQEDWNWGPEPLKFLEEEDLIGFFYHFGFECDRDEEGGIGFYLNSYHGNYGVELDYLLVSLGPAIIGDLIWETEEYGRYKQSFNFGKVYQSRMLPMEFGPGEELIATIW